MSCARVAIVTLAICVAACGGADDAPGARPEPLIVYASYEDTEYLPDFFKAYTDETGVYVTVRHQDTPANIANMIDGHNSRPADVFIARRVFDAWHVAENGGLRPLDATMIEGLVPESLRDPDNFWAGWSVRVPALVADHVAFGTFADEHADSSAWQQLARDDFKGSLCLSSSQISINRTLIAQLVRDLGRRETEIMVRTWLRNLALPPFDTERELLDALVSGVCSVGIASTQAIESGRIDLPAANIYTAVPEPVYPDVEAVGVGRHSRQPELAMQLVAWMLSAEQQSRHAAAISAAPAMESDHFADAGAAAWFDEEARSLAERAGYR